jgi:cell wall assembly regulator SMI1
MKPFRILAALRGRFSIDPTGGQVLSSELIAESTDLRAQIDVTYARDAAMGVLVPREMREKYTLKDGSRIEGRATYANFRRFRVNVSEAVK